MKTTQKRLQLRKTKKKKNGYNEVFMYTYIVMMMISAKYKIR